MAYLLIVFSGFISYVYNMNSLLDMPGSFSTKSFECHRIDGLPPDDLDSFLQQAENFMAFINSGYDGLDFNTEEMKRHCGHRAEADQSLVYAVYDRTTREAIGSIIYNRPGEKPEYCNLAYYIMPGKRGQGLAPKISEQAMDAFFQHTAFDEIYCAIWGNNKASLRVLEKLGFEYLGYRPSYIDPPPVIDHQFKMTRAQFSHPERQDVRIVLDDETAPGNKPPSQHVP